MADYKLSHEAKNDLIRIYLFGVERFGMSQADKYYNNLFHCFEMIAQRPFSFIMTSSRSSTTRSNHFFRFTL
ncbi:ParE toxin of type II toxin-antitoxin system, parDE [Algoriphagus faecimaris]|uniref:ParE toxin of type II toxin-antitoxin system, parDE n=1 Tax=Algoriphagus faecimaris TaxID=686796 RepID=A0A1G6MFY7_9BACT|nr:type II toxin-antitoxin system RelE/ParE family toxin [Algoriphagus faecimaris]SDC54187.1 ParE toxin of type II toxin-antitoxin system, parDE [Algoriphagus faecimaris]